MATAIIQPERRRRRARWSWYSRIEGTWAVLAVVAVVIAPRALVEAHPLAVATVVVPAILFGFVRVVAAIAKLSEPTA